MTDPLPSWTDGPAKQAIVTFVRKPRVRVTPKFLMPEERIATFDQDGTFWVEQPAYTQILFTFHQSGCDGHERSENKGPRTVH